MVPGKDTHGNTQLGPTTVELYRSTGHASHSSHAGAELPRPRPPSTAKASSVPSAAPFSKSCPGLRRSVGDVREAKHARLGHRSEGVESAAASISTTTRAARLRPGNGFFGFTERRVGGPARADKRLFYACGQRFGRSRHQGRIGNSRTPPAARSDRLVPSSRKARSMTTKYGGLPRTSGDLARPRSG